MHHVKIVLFTNIVTKHKCNINVLHVHVQSIKSILYSIKNIFDILDIDHILNSNNAF